MFIKSNLYDGIIFTRIQNYEKETVTTILSNYFLEKYYEDLCLLKSARLDHRKLIHYFLSTQAKCIPNTFSKCVTECTELGQKDLALFFYNRMCRENDRRNAEETRKTGIPTYTQVDPYVEACIESITFPEAERFPYLTAIIRRDLENIDKYIGKEWMDRKAELLISRRKDYGLINYIYIRGAVLIPGLVKSGNLPAVKYFSNKYPSPYSRSFALWWSVESGSIEMVKYCLDKCDGQTDSSALSTAVKIRNFEIIDFLLNNVWDIDYINRALSEAAFLGYKDVCEYLISRGAKGNKDFESAKKSAERGNYPKLVKFFNNKLYPPQKCIIL